MKLIKKDTLTLYSTNVSNKLSSCLPFLWHLKHKTTNIWCPFHYASFLELETQLRCDFHINFPFQCLPKKTPQATNLTVIAIYLFSRLICIKKNKKDSTYFHFPATRDYVLEGQISNRQSSWGLHFLLVVICGETYITNNILTVKKNSVVRMF